MERFAAIDFETANWQRTSVCSVGVVVVNRDEIEERFYSLIHPVPDFYTRKNTEIHGLSQEDTDEASGLSDGMEGNCSFDKRDPFVAHNSMFDEGCLKAVHAFYEMAYPDYRFYCTYRLSRKLFKGLENYQLHTVSAFCGYDLTRHHHALADAEACGVIMQKILTLFPVYKFAFTRITGPLSIVTCNVLFSATDILPGYFAGNQLLFHSG